MRTMNERACFAFVAYRRMPLDECRELYHLIHLSQKIQRTTLINLFKWHHGVVDILM